jgi:predicted AlkP superfamily phosphohydrolase/phosphomutase
MYDWFDAVCLPQILKINADYRVIISDHGWRSFTEEGKGKRFDGAIVYGEHDLGGIMAINGPDIPEDTEIFCNNIDLLPTILHAFNLPEADVAGNNILTKCSELEDINKLLSGLGYIE